jgi:hypothetical protein
MKLPRLLGPRVRGAGHDRGPGSDRPRAAAPPGLRAPQQPKLDAIEYAFAKHHVRSFVDLGGIGAVYGAYAVHAMGQPGVRAGTLADMKINDYAREQADEHGVRCVDGDFTDPRIIREIGKVDAILLFDVLLHTVDPDWDRLLELYADSARVFVIANPQWDGDTTVRLIDLGREGFLEAVPPTPNHREVFDRLDEVHPMFGRPYRDAMHIWQWGITDHDLIEKMASLGFTLDRADRHGAFWEANGFQNTTMVFRR